MDDIKALQEQIKSICSRLEAIETVFNINPSDIENKEAARKQYETATEEERKLSERISDDMIQDAINKTKTTLPFIYKTDLYNAYAADRIQKHLTPLIRKAFYAAANRAGYPNYTFNGKQCIWISDKPKPKPGKRPKKKI